MSHADRVTIVTLSRADKRNAMNRALCERLCHAVEAIHRRRSRAIVITGSGTSFCSGADLDEVYHPGFRDALYTSLHAIADSPIPVIAAVNGPAIGAGAQLAIAADLRTVTPTARFAVPTARIGLAVDPWTIRRLALLAGQSTARQLLVACTDIDATTALACGLVDRPGTLQDAISWASEIAELAPLTIAYYKRALNAILEPALPDGSDSLTVAFEACWNSADVVEGRRARAENRRPLFNGV